MLTWQTLLIVLALLAAGAWLHGSLGALERARGYCNRSCSEAGLQFLDHSIALVQLRPVWQRGRLHWRRRYRFEVSFDGFGREHGQLSMLGQRLEWVRLPEPQPPGWP